MLQVLGFGGALSIRARLSSRIVLQLIDTVGRQGFLSKYNVLNFELSSKKTKIVKQHYILK